jgi:uncharacterized protein
MAEVPYVLLVHGYADAGRGHWQNWLAGELAGQGGSVDIPEFADPAAPELGAWLAELRDHLAVAPRDVERVVLAHSWGALLWLHHAARGCRPEHRVDRVLLVAPPGPDWEQPEVIGFQPAPADAAGLRYAAPRTRLVVGDDDPACPVPYAKELAAALDVDLDVVHRAGHLNSAAGYGPWPAALAWALDGSAPLRGHGSGA